jgi:hypothetical protein
MKKGKKQSSDNRKSTQRHDTGLEDKKNKPDPKNVQKLRENVQLHQKPLIMRNSS